jgi:hypothetical protein
MPLFHEWREPTQAIGFVERKYSSIKWMGFLKKMLFEIIKGD